MSTGRLIHKDDIVQRRYPEDHYKHPAFDPAKGLVVTELGRSWCVVKWPDMTMSKEHQKQLRRVA
jgi:hypothetical protein